MSFGDRLRGLTEMNPKLQAKARRGSDVHSEASSYATSGGRQQYSRTPGEISELSSSNSFDGDDQDLLEAMDPEIRLKAIGIASRVLTDEAQAIVEVAKRIKDADTESSEQFARAISFIQRSLEAGGKVVVTGVGKSGRIGKKITATLQSTGTVACFLHPVEAMHGDLGVVVGDGKDVVIGISNSGNTEELLQILPSLHKRGVPVIALCGSKTSKLGKASDAWLDAAVKDEASQDVPAPTTSTTVAMALGDALALTLMELREFTSHNFALNHPGGSLGRKLLLKIRDVMHPANDVPTVSAEMTLDHVLAEMTRHKTGAVLVVESMDTASAVSELDADISPAEIASKIGARKIAQAKRRMSQASESGRRMSTSSGRSGKSQINEDDFERLPLRILGIISAGDVRKVLEMKEKMFTMKAKDVMTVNPVVCKGDDMAGEVKKRMEEERNGDGVDAMPVLCGDSGDWMGLVLKSQLDEMF